MRNPILNTYFYQYFNGKDIIQHFFVFRPEEFLVRNISLVALFPSPGMKMD